MEEELISKKDLLDLTGISYGQLYRWKRKNIIPEGWFIKKSSFTGQETYFPRDRILERISKIKEMKDGLSLDELAEKFSPEPCNIIFTTDDLIKRNIVTMETIHLYENIMGKVSQFNFDNILMIHMLEDVLSSGSVSLDEAKSMMILMKEKYKNLKGKECEFLLVRKFGIGTGMLCQMPNNVQFDEGTRIVFRAELRKHIEELKLKLAQN